MELDASPLLAYAERLTAESGERVTVTHLVGRAIALGLRAVPEFNHRVLFGRVVAYPRVDVGFAVDVAEGDDLAPATLRDVDRMTTVEIAREVRRIVTGVRSGQDRDFAVSNRIVEATPWFVVRPTLALMSVWNGGLGRRALGQPGFPLGNAFVSNVGSMGLDEGVLAPIPFARCPLYICVGTVRDRPMAVDGQLVVRPGVVLTATADHRVVDGAHAAKLAGFLRQVLSEPEKLDA